MAITTMDDFKSYIKHFSHPNQYDFILTPPSRMGLPSAPDSKALRIFGKSMSVPSITSENNITRIMNMIRGTALGINYDSCVITFYDTKTMFFHRLFTAWMQNRFDTNGTMKFYPDDYSGDIGIYLHDNQTYKLENVYPLTVGDFRLDNDLTDQYGTFDVTLFVTKSTPQSGGFSNA